MVRGVKRRCVKTGTEGAVVSYTYNPDFNVVKDDPGNLQAHQLRNFGMEQAKRIVATLSRQFQQKTST